MNQLPVQADHVDQEALDEPVLPHDPHRPQPALLGELEVAVCVEVQQTVALHPSDGLAHRGPD